LFFVLQLFQVTCEAQAIVTTDYPVAIGALPFSSLRDQEFLNAVLFDVFKVLDHTHVVMCSVTVVKVLQVSARKIRTFKAILDLIFQKQLTAFSKKCTLLSSRPTTCAIRHPAPFSFDVILQSEAATADRTVHAAGGYQNILHHAFYYITGLKRPPAFLH